MILNTKMTLEQNNGKSARAGMLELKMKLNQFCPITHKSFSCFALLTCSYSAKKSEGAELFPLCFQECFFWYPQTHDEKFTS